MMIRMGVGAGVRIENMKGAEGEEKSREQYRPWSVWISKFYSQITVGKLRARSYLDDSDPALILSPTPLEALGWPSRSQPPPCAPSLWLPSRRNDVSLPIRGSQNSSVI